MRKAAKSDVFTQEYNDVRATCINNFDEDRFQLQLETLQYCANVNVNARIHFVTGASWNLKVQSHLSEVFKLIKLNILVLTVNKSTSEKAFSLLKLIKSYLRSIYER